MTAFQRMAQRAESEPFFLGHTIARYAAANRLSDADLCERLGCDAERLAAVKLCRCPGPTPTMVAEDVRVIAERMGVSATELARIVLA